MPQHGALDGVFVLDLSRLLPGPYCSMILGDHGARVVSVEDRRFLADGLFINIINRNKEHMSLNLKSSKGREIFHQLAQKADVLIEGFRPGVVRRLGVDYDSICSINPKIIYCSVSGYGQNGPLRDHVGHDVNYMGRAGVLNLIGEPDRPPSIPGVPVADIAAGGMNAAIGILLALFAREKTGQGQYIDISMTDGMVGFLPSTLFFQQLTGHEPGRSDGILSHRYACYNTYTTADDRHITIGAVENRFWNRLCELLNVPEYGPLQFDEKRRKEILNFVRAAFRQRTLEQWQSKLADHDICWGPIQNLTEVLNDPLFEQREMIVDIEDKDGKKSQTIGVPVKLSATPGSIRKPSVGFGESTSKILSELGYSQDEIKKFAEEGVI